MTACWMVTSQISSMSLTSFDLNLTPLMKDWVPQNCSDFQSPFSPTREAAELMYWSWELKQASSTALRLESSFRSPWSGSTFNLNPWAQELSGQNVSCPQSPLLLYCYYSQWQDTLNMCRCSLVQSPLWLLAVGIICAKTGRESLDIDNGGWLSSEAAEQEEASNAEDINIIHEFMSRIQFVPILKMIFMIILMSTWMKLIYHWLWNKDKRALEDPRII